MKVTGKRAVLAVQEALGEAGLGRTSGYSGGEITGWIDRNQYGSTGFSVKKLSDGDLTWHVVISGKPHLRYREWTERRDGDSIDLHEPVNPNALAPRIRAAFETLGLKVRKVEHTGAQMHWDDDVDYEIVTDHPEWLGPADKSNASQDGAGPLLKTMARGGKADGNLPALRGSLVGYVHAGRSYLTRESLEALVAQAKEDEALRQQSLARHGATPHARVPAYLRERGPDLALSEAGELALRPSRQPETRVAPETLVNHWGDEVQVWRVPSSSGSV
jgi:hypothetical protein